MTNSLRVRGLRLARWAGLLWLVVLGLASARAQSPALLTDTWAIHAGTANGFLQLSQDADGRLSGTLLGRTLTGLYSPRDGVVAFVVGSPGAPHHLFYGERISQAGQDVIAGIGVSLRAGQTQFGASIGSFTWEARRGAGSAPAPTSVTKTAQPSSWVDVSGRHTASNPKATIRFQQAAGGDLAGSWNGGDLQGHFEQASGLLSAVRLVNGLPTEAVVSHAIDLPGSTVLVALSPEALQRMAGVAYARWDLALRGAGNLAGRWQINGNGWPGTLELTQDADGRITGAIYGGEPVQGFYARSERRLVLLRGPLQRPIQAFVGEVSADGERWQGQLHTLDAGPSGGSFGRNLFAFAAERYGPAPSALPSLPVTQGTAPALPRLFYFYNRPSEFQNTQRGHLDFSAIGTDNSFDGTLYGDPVFGHFAVSTGVLAMVRSRGGVPIQFFVGQAQAWPRQPEAFVPRFVGRFHALHAEGGALPSRMSFDWSANWATCGLACPAY